MLRDQSFQVSEQVCQECCKNSVEESLHSNQVIQSLLFEACSKRLSGIGPHGGGQRHYELNRTLKMAETALVQDSFRQAKHPGNWACDVIIPIPEFDKFGMSLPAVTSSIQAVLEQKGVVVFAHLVGESHIQKVAQQIDLPRQVFVHNTAPSQQTRGREMHFVFEKLKTEWVSWHDVRYELSPTRLKNACRSLWLSGADLSLSPIQRGLDDIQLTVEDFRSKPTPNAFRGIASLLCRRATLVDLGGLIDSDDALVDFVRRAVDQEFLVLFDTGASELSIDRDFESDSPLAVPSTTSDEPSVPLGFQQQKVECDLVLPFFNHLDFAQQAMDGALNQENSDVTIHLIDDASTENTHSFMKQWSGHRQVRCYRNRENIGQFMSLNNAVKFCETELIAVQDADDISMPHRITTGGNLLRLCDGDFFGGAVQLFGDDNLIRPVHEKTDHLELVERAERRFSFFPPASSIPYFLENPTAIFRRDMFCQRGGYADFGTREMNRASLDSEFLLRCFFSGVRFAITRKAVTHYRVHKQSATQNRVTGWGTDARAQSSQIVYENTLRFRSGPFDPRIFGSLGKYQDVIEPIN